MSKSNDSVIDRSGSCAVILLIIDSKIYIANCGDSRCIMSLNNELREITIDHKPNFPKEKKRIYDNGGQVYQSQTPINNNVNNNNQYLIGPYRVFPGRLSVSRTIGDIEAKNTRFGGNPYVIIAEPEIYSFDLNKDNIDFFIMGCDGIFDQLSNKDVFDCAWKIFKNSSQIIKENNNIHTQCGKIVDFILKSAMSRKSFDNITCLIIALKDFNYLEKKDINQSEIIPQKVTSIPLSNITNKIYNSHNQISDDLRRMNQTLMNQKLENKLRKNNENLIQQKENNKDGLYSNKYNRDVNQERFIPHTSNSQKRPILINVNSQNVMPINISYQSFKENAEIAKNPRRNSEALIHSAKTPYKYTTNTINYRNNPSPKYEMSSIGPIPSNNLTNNVNKDNQSSRPLLLNTNPNKEIPRKSSIDKEQNMSYNIYIPRARHNKYGSFNKRKKELELNSHIVGNNNNVNSNFSLRKGVDIKQNNNNSNNENDINAYFNFGRSFVGNNNLSNSNSQRYITTGGIRYNFHY